MTFFLVVAIATFAISLIATLLLIPICRASSNSSMHSGLSQAIIGIALMVAIRYTFPISVGSALLYALLSSNIPLMIICLLGVLVIGLGELWLRT